MSAPHNQCQPGSRGEPCSNCNGTKRALYFSEQAMAHETRDCHVCRAPAPDGAREAVAWIALSNDQEKVRIWWRDKERAEEWAKTHSAPVIPLYASPACADAFLPLRAPAPHQSFGVQTDYVMVPREPTPQMVAAGMGEIPEDGSEYEHIESAYRAMIAAASSLPSANSPSEAGK